jgi:DNA-binding LacI/PurR family transcriptional regulator
MFGQLPVFGKRRRGFRHRSFKKFGVQVCLHTSLKASMPKTSPSLPKYWQLAEHFREQMQSGVLKPGDRLPSLAEMRARQVSRATMDKVHSILEQEGLISRQPGYGTFVLKPTAAQAKGIIGLCGWGFHYGSASLYWQELLGGIHQLSSSGSQVLLLHGDVSDGWEKVDGAIVVDWMEPKYQSRIPAQLPIVRLFKAQRGRASIVADEYSGQLQAVRHLLELGHRSIAYLSGWNLPPASDRVRGYEDALRAAAIKPHKNWRRALQSKCDYGPEFLEAGRSAMKACIDDAGSGGWKNIGCTALLCHNDETALGAMQALNEAGYMVPADVSIIGFDGTVVGEYSRPRLTTVQMPLRKMGEKAVEMLEAQIAADDVLARTEVLPLNFWCANQPRRHRICKFDLRRQR